LVVIIVKLEERDVSPLSAICIIIITFPHNPLTIS
jgi:hypothetical protein